MNARRPSVLLADNNVAVLTVVSQVVSEDFDIVATVLDGETALREAQCLRPDIVVLDIAMERLSGLEVPDSYAIEDLCAKSSPDGSPRPRFRSRCPRCGRIGLCFEAASQFGPSTVTA
jgi:response regulator receiver domain-containing protein